MRLKFSIFVRVGDCDGNLHGKKHDKKSSTLDFKLKEWFDILGNMLICMRQLASLMEAGGNS